MLNKIQTFLKSLRLKQLIYPVTIVVLVIGTIVIFIATTRSLSAVFTKAFTLDEGAIASELIKIDLLSFYPVAKKLGIEIEIPPPPETSPSASPADKSAETAPLPSEDKTELKISVLNGTNVTGLAAGLKKSLTDAGFAVSKIGDFSSILEVTTMHVKESKKKYSSLIKEIKEIASQKYQLGEDKILGENDPHDVMITIGQQLSTSPADEPAPTPPPEAAPLPPEDKTELKISLLKSTDTNSQKYLKILSRISAAGFVVGKTGSHSSAQETTTIQIKESKKTFISSIAEIKNIISEDYTLGETQTLDENDSYDIVIIIGLK